LRPSSRPLESPSRIAARIPVRCSRRVRARRDERLELRAAGPCQPGVEVLGRERGILEVVEQPQLLAQQEGAVEAVVVLDVGERGELADRLVLWGAQQRPAGVLDPAALGRVRAVVAVSLVAPGRSRALRGARRGRGQGRSRRSGRPGGWRAGTRRSCRSRPPGSTRAGRRAARRSPARSDCCGRGRTTRSPRSRGRRRWSGSGDGGDRRSRRRRCRPGRRAGARRADRRSPARRSARSNASRPAATA
jgi:hypothetical protein